MYMKEAWDSLDYLAGNVTWLLYQEAISNHLLWCFLIQINDSFWNVDTRKVGLKFLVSISLLKSLITFDTVFLMSHVWPISAHSKDSVSRYTPTTPYHSEYGCVSSCLDYRISKSEILLLYVGWVVVGFFFLTKTVVRRHSSFRTCLLHFLN